MSECYVVALCIVCIHGGVLVGEGGIKLVFVNQSESSIKSDTETTYEK